MALPVETVIRKIRRDRYTCLLEDDQAQSGKRGHGKISLRAALMLVLLMKQILKRGL